MLDGTELAMKWSIGAVFAPSLQSALAPLKTAARCLLVPRWCSFRSAAQQQDRRRGCRTESPYESMTDTVVLSSAVNSAVWRFYRSPSQQTVLREASVDVVRRNHDPSENGGSG
ncbi:hypothetical protein CORC01_07286 [Colletotrichum orchidophilum]|uniref:Uncharacterized protein n=1 Tax=Colletotrichum orchidophilum TaxID=1209926 RepID=A0A1G4B7I3_9PEZI|nr:uncharacterized protein CORC01_07286 [Colletotrichum orchidophilum]OHE97381.1 hypothetical protein CORC01_07286 [Colletotrichum orchidophilum]